MSEWPTRELEAWVDPRAPICYGVVVPGPETTDGPVIVRVCDYANGPIPSDGLRTISDEVHRAYARSKIRPGDILLAIRGAVGHVGEVPDGLGEANITQDSVRVRVARKIDRDYLRHALTSPSVQAAIRFEVVGQAVQGINVRDVRQLAIPCPPEPVRQQIAAILDRYSDVDRLLDRLIDAKARLRDGLAQALLTGRRRLPAFAGLEWREARIGEVTRELTRRNGGKLGADRVMAVNKTHGMIPMRERTIADDRDRYKVVPPGAFAYNPMRINIGSIARSHFEHDTLVSPDYVVFDADGCDPRYLDWLRRTSLWRRHMAIAGNGGVRVRIYYDDLALMKVRLPDADEQSAIADILDAATRDIDALTRLREAVAKQKRGLMQQLLTGRLRVPEVRDA